MLTYTGVNKCCGAGPVGRRVFFFFDGSGFDSSIKSRLSVKLFFNNIPPFFLEKNRFFKVFFLLVFYQFRIEQREYNLEFLLLYLGWSREPLWLRPKCPGSATLVAEPLSFQAAPSLPLFATTTGKFDHKNVNFN